MDKVVASPVNRMCWRENRHYHDPKSAKYCVLAKSIATLSKNVNVMAAHMSSKSDKDDDAKPVTDGKMASNAKDSAITKTQKRRRTDARLCLVGTSVSGVIFLLMSLISL